VEAHCIDVERIGEIVDFPANHPERQHAETCPRCRSLVESYRAFMNAEAAPDSGLEKARGVLDARIRQDAERWTPSTPRTSALSRASWWSGLFRPAPLMVATAVVAIAAVFVWTSRGPQDSTLRDDAAHETLLALQPSQVDGHAILLSWAAMEGADAYQVRIYGPDLNEIYRHPDVAGTSVTVDRSELPGDLPPTLDLTWRVYALLGGDVIEVSEPGSIRAP